MPYGPVVVFSGSIASGASTLTSVDLSKSWRAIYAKIPSLSTSAELAVYGSSDGSNFYQVFTTVQTATTQWVYQTHTVASGVGANGGIAPLQAFTRYVQFRASGTIGGGAAIDLICSD